MANCRARESAAEAAATEERAMAVWACAVRRRVVFVRASVARRARSRAWQCCRRDYSRQHFSERISLTVCPSPQTTPTNTTTPDSSQTGQRCPFTSLAVAKMGSLVRGTSPTAMRRRRGGGRFRPPRARARGGRRLRTLARRDRRRRCLRDGAQRRCAATPRDRGVRAAHSSNPRTSPAQTGASASGTSTRPRRRPACPASRASRTSPRAPTTRPS